MVKGKRHLPCKINSKNNHENDVYFARGHGVRYKGGNIKYRKLIQQMKKSYQAADKNREKDRIANKVVEEIINSGGTFYYKSDASTNCWIIVPRRELLTKIKQALRTKTKGVEKKREPKMDHLLEVAAHEDGAEGDKLQGEDSLSPLPHNKQEEDNSLFMTDIMNHTSFEYDDDDNVSISNDDVNSLLGNE